MDPEIKRLPYEVLKHYTDNFSEENYIGNFQFGKVYRGKIEKGTFGTQHVVVKIWEASEIYMYNPGDNELRLMDEIVLLQHEKLVHHPAMVKMYGYCCEGERLGVVYDYKPLDTVCNLLVKDGFTWLQRIKVALGFACLLKFFHAGNSRYERFVFRNLDAAHIMVDEEYNPKLIDFSMITGGIFPDKTVYRIQSVFGSYGYIDLSYSLTGGWTDGSDVFAFGVVLLGLITKRVGRRINTAEDKKSDEPFLYEWAQSEYTADKSDLGIQQSRRSLVHPSLVAEPVFCFTDGRKITRLAMKCVDDESAYRPTMKQVVEQLLKLQVVKDHADFLGMDRMLRRHHDK